MKMKVTRNRHYEGNKTYYSLEFLAQGCKRFVLKWFSSEGHTPALRFVVDEEKPSPLVLLIPELLV